MRFLALVLAGAFAAACGAEEPKTAHTSRKSSDASGAAPAAPAPGPTPVLAGKNPGTGAVAPTPAPGEAPAPAPAPAPATPAPAPTPTGPAAETGKDFFTRVISPLFDAQCTTCHADPREMPDIRGPLTIFSYGTMKKYLVDGTSAADNGMIRKMRALVAHAGSDRCREKGPAATPCKEVMEWWRLELGADSGLVGKLVQVTALGDVSGYAVASDDVAEVLSVELHVDVGVDGPAAMTPVLTLTADQAGEDAGYEGQHAFRGSLPAELRDGKERDLTAWVEKDGKLLQLGAKVRFAAYAPKDAGKTYYQNTVMPALQGRCGSCHLVSYEQHYGSLINKAPFQGGTAMDNELINRAAGGDAHPGGNICGGKAGTPCNLLQQWWGLEFGP